MRVAAIAIALCGFVAGCIGETSRTASRAAASGGNDELIARVAPSTQPAESRSVLWSELGQSVPVIGPLNEPLGKVLMIEGRAVPQSDRHTYWEVNMAQDLFSVEKVNGVKLTGPVRIELGFMERGAGLTDKYSKFQGYQDGTFENYPDEVMRILNERGESRQQSNWHFSVRFVVIDRPQDFK